VAHTNGVISIWDIRNSEKILQNINNIHSIECRSCEFDYTGKYITSSSFDKSICIYNLDEGKIENTIKNHTDRVVLSMFHPNN
jgi:WD40 repeat protein